MPVAPARPAGPAPETKAAAAADVRLSTPARWGARGRFRAQPPVLSPVPLDAALAAGVALLGAPDPRPALLRQLLGLYGAESGVLCASGTQALRLALEAALRQAGGGTVALPAYSCYDVAAAAVAAATAEAGILLYDLDPATLSPDLDSLERVLAQGARVVVAAPLYGVPVDWDALRQSADRHGAALVEDAAQGLGASWQDRPLGGLGAVSVLSFGRGKGWTGGAGGAVLFRHGFPAPPAPPRSSGLRAEVSAVARAGAQSVFGRPGLYGVPLALPWLGLGDTVYRDAEEPAGMPRVAARLLLQTRREAEAEAEARRRNAAALLAALTSSPTARLIRPPAGGVPGYLRLPLRLDRGMAALGDARTARRLGIVPGYPSTLGRLAALRAHLAGVPDVPGAELLARTLVTLPVHSAIGEAEREQVLRLIDTCPR